MSIVGRDLPMLLTATIELVSAATPRARLVRIAGDEPFVFRAGQAVLVGQHGQPERRPYSIAIGPEEALNTGRLEFLIGLGADGLPGSHLPDLAPGVRVDVEGPFGAFTFPAAPIEQQFLFVAGGSGIAPIRSMVQHALAVNSDWRLSLVYSARVPEELAFDAELASLSLDGRLRYYRTATRNAGDTWAGARGRIDRALLDQCIETSETLCFVCGPESLVHEVPRLLRGIGIGDSRIRIEEWTAPAAE